MIVLFDENPDVDGLGRGSYYSFENQLNIIKLKLNGQHIYKKSKFYFIYYLWSILLLVQLRTLFW